MIVTLMNFAYLVPFGVVAYLVYRSGRPSKISIAGKTVYSKRPIRTTILSFIVTFAFVSAALYLFDAIIIGTVVMLNLGLAIVLGILGLAGVLVMRHNSFRRSVPYCSTCDDVFDYGLMRCPSCDGPVKRVAVSSTAIKHLHEAGLQRDRSLVSTAREYKPRVEQWKSEGYDTSQLRDMMARIKNQRQRVQILGSFEGKIQRLKNLEKELNALNPVGFEADVQSIRDKLKRPQAVQEVEKELAYLKIMIDAKRVEEVGESAIEDMEPIILPGRGTRLSRPPLGGDISKNYEILDLMGFGGFADVYKAKRKADDTIVALKVPRLAQFETVVQPTAFLDEARLWSRLRHASIVSVFEYGAKPYPWIAVEYMEGGSLRTRIGRLSLEESLDIALKVCDALYYAHHLGIIHRDIKPENILFDKDNNPKLADWGLGKMMMELSSRSGSAGSPAYSSPEQVKPAEFGEVGWWTDIYQCGAVLYEMITGQLPINGDSPLELALNIVSAEVARPSEIRSGLPVELDEIVAQCLAKDRQERYEDISMMRATLNNVKRSL